MSTSQDSSAETQNYELTALVREKIENLRPKLLDLTRRNPLISTKFPARSNSHLRVVDELPDILFFNLVNAQKMRLIPLPALDEDPRDELTRDFQDAVSSARFTDEIYLADLEKLNQDSEDAGDKTRKLERELRDRLREARGMPVRANKNDISLVQHAKNNGISPSFDLPDPTAEAGDDRYSDANIQTLLLPKDLERKTNSLITKCRTWVQETGINVLHAAYGFLEWSDPATNDSGYAPLVLCGVQIEKRKSLEGPQFWVTGIEEDPEVNTVLAEKLRLEYGIEIPEFEGGSIEGYLAKIAQISSGSLKWRVRRQVAIGVFPSARMAMYHDLDTSTGAFDKNEIVKALFGGSAGFGTTPFADEYDVDASEIEAQVPHLVLDADSSQFSTLVDVARGNNVAVEGPPGTGKSQTIVNAIAAALAKGKKVLFVAEKMAALDVVKSRLEAVGLGDFLLPLQADRSARETVINSIRKRLDARPGRNDPSLEMKRIRFNDVRNELKAYIEVVSAPFRDTGFSVYDILGKSIATGDFLEGLPRSIQSPTGPEIERCGRFAIENAMSIGRRVQQAWQEAANTEPYWSGIARVHLDKFQIDRLSALAEETAERMAVLSAGREKLLEYGVGYEATEEDISAIASCLETLRDLAVDEDSELVVSLSSSERITQVKDFLSSCSRCRAVKAALAEKIVDPDDKTLSAKVGRANEICGTFGYPDLNLKNGRAKLHSEVNQLSKDQELLHKLERFESLVPESSSWPVSAFSKLTEIAGSSGLDVLALRTALNSDPGASPLLKKGIETGRTLCENRNRLAAIFAVERDFSDTELFAHIAAFRGAGLFKAFSPTYKAARRHYSSYSRRNGFELQQAIADLTEVTTWREHHSKFLSSHSVTTLFGVQFNGIDTDFDKFERLLEFYGRIDSAFAGPEFITVRKFMKNADLDLLKALPMVEASQENRTVAEMRGQLSERQTKAEVLRQNLIELETLTAIYHHPEQISYEDLSDIINDLDTFQNLRQELDDGRAAKKILGDYFNGSETDPDSFNDVVTASEVVLEMDEFSSLVRGFLSEERLSDAVPVFLNAVELTDDMRKAVDALSNYSGLADDHWLADRDLNEAAEFLSGAASDIDGMQVHSRFRTARNELSELDFDWIVRDLLEKRLPLSQLPDVIEATAIRRLAEAVFDEHRAILAKYNGKRLDECRATLASLDRDIISLSRKRLRSEILAFALPPHGVGHGRKSDYTEMSLINNEIEKKKRHVSTRDLTRRAGRALMELKPCWMMSPLAVAQYLPRGAHKFDLCIIDEASQMPPEDSVGALVRSAQTMVVGDTKQLPPTSFFRKMIDDDDADEDEVVLEESVLEMANASFRPARRLRWHYRSRHSGLIKFSNHMVYDDNLVVFPSATESLPTMGVFFRKVDGLYHAGANPVEAKTIVDAAVEFMKKDPDRSLGIVTLNQKQQALIQEEWEYILNNNRDAARYVERWMEKNDGLERFFIKNLENVQGDERDVIFIGTVYGPEKPGAKTMQRFGPINGLAGKRRLNVLFSRAKQQIVTFSSMTSADVIADEHSNPGVYMLKRWLEYSASGVLQTGTDTEKQPDSAFESFVIEQINSMGCTAVPQVGVAGYFIDIGVRHPKWPHGFILGVECDGAGYHSSKSARDRDRLRQEVLEHLGWRFHRIWSTDWFNNPRAEAERLRSVIESRMKELSADEASFRAAPPEPKEPSEPIEIVVSPPRSDLAPERPVASQSPAIQLDLRMSANAPAPKPKAPDTSLSLSTRIEVGDRVRVRYTTGNKAVIQVILSDRVSDPSKGIVNVNSPMGEAIVGAEEGDGVEILVGSYLRPAIIEKIMSRGN